MHACERVRHGIESKWLASVRVIACEIEHVLANVWDIELNANGLRVRLNVCVCVCVCVFCGFVKHAPIIFLQNPP